MPNPLRDAVTPDSTATPKSATWKLSITGERSGGRQVNPECGARAQAAFDGDMAAALGDDPVGGRQAEPGALALLLGGEERLEDAAQCLLRHAVAGVAHADADERAVTERDVQRVAQRRRHRRVARLDAHL